ncbi:DNA-binding GntR family transcriptional regulator [Microbacterium phyllosphaerae]|uniref:DNA-binding GntR family transcriptional regulator n=1 Tax=Microbacterium phyllosphaerae TaxID=124798 RepID=A0ABS4WNN7_9MICO|nr:GntR family transcriptional regulator [Microbacterium phyllosphaerae]MBP2377558.1 DNA-binding GntR family transcriptional regulator [Microbacterium phyllosphaerae]
MPVPKTPARMPRKLLRDQIFDTLLDAIVAGDLAAGEPISDKQLETWLGASRTPIREAVNRLAGMGLIEVLPQKGTRIAPLDPTRFREEMEMLGVVYSATVREATALLTDADRAQIRDLHRAVSQNTDALERARIVDALMNVFIDRYRNTLVQRIREKSVPHVTRMITARPGALDATETSAALDALAAAAASGDADAAALATRDYFTAGAASVTARDAAEIGGTADGSAAVGFASTAAAPAAAALAASTPAASTPTAAVPSAAVPTENEVA